ncbi:hypothetical protein CT3_15850 [Comamonas terrigena NBRC 13299]|nr:hypothetical protein CT3_15850 [Comamonas terrigena NBRC 13299]
MQAGVLKVEIYLNELSFHGQFQEISEFKNALDLMMEMRLTARRFGREIHCRKNISEVKITHNKNLHQIIGALTLNEQRALIEWFNRRGPFWEDGRQHSADDYLEHNGDVITESSLGEAAYCIHLGIDRRTASTSPSTFLSDPLKVNFHLNNQNPYPIDVKNYYSSKLLEDELKASAPSPLTWNALAGQCRLRFVELSFSEDCFEPLDGLPFSQSAAISIIDRLSVLNEFKTCFDLNGQRTPRGHFLYQEYFTGDKGWFSDSSDTEKIVFKNELNFNHPANNGGKISCPWHGKIKLPPQYRIHFSWPVAYDQPLHIVYTGPKITKK